MAERLLAAEPANAATICVLSPILRLEDLEDFVLAAELYRTARRAGVTIHKTLDCLIAAPCVRTGAQLLHADHDFDRWPAVRRFGFG